MNERSIDYTEAIAWISQAYGMHCWFVRCAEDRILRIEFGKPHLSIHEPRAVGPEASALTAELFGRRIVNPDGQYSLFIEDGNWSVAAGTYTCCRTDEESINTSISLSRLSGQVLIGFDIKESGECEFKFDLGGVLLIDYLNEFDENSQWTMFKDDGGYLSNDNRGGFVLKIGT